MGRGPGRRRAACDCGGSRSAAASGELLLPLPTGALTLAQLDLLFRALPFDVTYVDENDRVRFYSEGERVFPRSPGAIGREVRNCHPPKSLAQGRGDPRRSSRPATKDEAEFWIEMGPQVHPHPLLRAPRRRRRLQGLPRGRSRRHPRALAVGQPPDRRLVAAGIVRSRCRAGSRRPAARRASRRAAWSA